MGTVHNMANKGEIAKNCLMAGDPLRAKFVAEKYLSDVKLVNTIRNMLCYTGTYKGKKVSVMGSGMGMPSLGIYAYELYDYYDVDNIIRIGSCGAIAKGLNLYDTIVVKDAYTKSNFASQLGLGKMKKLPSSKLLFDKALEMVKGKSGYMVGNICSTDVFYAPKSENYDYFVQKGCLGVEMEAFGLFAIAKILGKNALTVLTVSDIVGEQKETTPKERETTFDNMVILALDLLDNLN